MLLNLSLTLHLSHEGYFNRNAHFCALQIKCIINFKAVPVDFSDVTIIEKRCNRVKEMCCKMVIKELFIRWTSCVHLTLLLAYFAFTSTSVLFLFVTRLAAPYSPSFVQYAHYPSSAHVQTTSALPL